MTALIERIQRQPRVAAGVSLLLGWALFFAPAILGRGVLYERDLLYLYIPLRDFVRERLAQGDFPEWFPYDVFGAPLIGQIVPALFHPLTWLTLPLPAPTGVLWTLLFGDLAMMIGAYKASRSLGADRTGSVLGAFALAFGGYALGMHNNPPYLLGLAAMTWVLHAALLVAGRGERRDAALLALSWALVFLGGDAQGFAMSGLLVLGAFAVHGSKKPRVMMAAVAGLTASMLCGIELAPALTWAGDSWRSIGGSSDALGLTWALHPLQWADFLVPGFAPPSLQAEMGAKLFSGLLGTWSSSLFVGLVTLSLAITAAVSRERKTLVLLILAITGLSLALGSHLGVLPIAWKLVPPLTLFRYPQKYLALTMTALAPLVALGFRRALNQPRFTAALLAAAALAALFVVPMAWDGRLVDALWQAANMPSPTGDRRDFAATTWTIGLTTDVLFTVAGCIALIFSKRRPALGWVFALLVPAELWLSNSGLVRLAPAEAFDSVPAFAAPIRAAAPANGPAPRTHSTAIDPASVPGATDNAARYVAHKRSAIWGAALTHEKLASLVSGLPGLSDRERLLLDGALVHPWFPVLNTCFIIGSRGERIPEGSRVVARDVDAGLGLAQMPCRGRAFLAGAHPVGSRDEAARALYGTPSIATADVVVREGGEQLEPPQGGHVTWLAYEPEQLSIEVETPSTAALVVSDALRAGWTATLDGAPAELVPADLALRSVTVPAGKHRIEMTYRTPHLASGALVSLAGLAFMVMLAIPRKSGARTRSSPPPEGGAPS